jgi:hypothetical protein
MADTAITEEAPATTLRVVSPEGPAATTIPVELSHGLESLAGRGLGFLSNTKPNIDLLLQTYASLLQQRYGITSFQARKRNAAVGAGPLVTEVSAQADGVVTGIADCGACTAQSSRDTVAFERDGVPAVLITTTAFEELAMNQARFAGAERIRVIVLPHPFESLGADEVVARAEATVEQLAELLAGDNGTNTGAAA